MFKILRSYTHTKEEENIGEEHRKRLKWKKYQNYKIEMKKNIKYKKYKEW